MTQVSVIVPNYNGRALLPECLDGLLRQSRPADEIVVVDDGSSDGSAAYVHDRYPQVKVIDLGSNGGFCRAANAGLRAAGGHLLALLNNDAVADEAWLEELAAALENDARLGSCASKMLFDDRREVVNSVGLFMRVDGVGRDLGYGQTDGPEFSAPRLVFGASGGAAIYRRAMLDDVGLLDEDLVAYGEDLDLSFRAQLRGWPCLFVPGARVYHRGGATYRPGSPARIYRSSRNMLTVLFKSMPDSLLRRYAFHIAAAQAYQVLYNAARGRGLAALRGKLDAVCAWPRTMDKRRKIQQSRRASDSEIEGLLLSWRRQGRWERLSAKRHGVET